MSLEHDVANKLSRLFGDKKSKTTPYDTQAEVKRVEGRTAWVHIPGGVNETPVKLMIGAKKGDTVMVRVSGGKAWLLGNETSPPTNDTEEFKRVDIDFKKLLKRIKNVEGGMKIEGLVRFADLESDEETVINGGNIDATSMAIKESYSMYNGAERRRIIAFEEIEPFPGFKSYLVHICPDGDIPVCQIDTDQTRMKALSAATAEGAVLTFDSELFYLDLPVYDSNFEPVGTIKRALQATPTYDGVHVNLQSPAVYDRTAGGSANVGVNQYGTIYRVSSSRRYKHDIKDLALEEARKLLNIRPRTFKYNDDFLEQADEKAGKDVPGFISEEVAEWLPIAVDHDDDGNCEMWNANIMIPCMLKLIQNQEQRITSLETEVREMKENANG